ncbi:MAG: hypothetical protein E7650_04065 [Ruminococcaceae bacterium]|nr:hypothetical protein [Oscillospiraceae bacterium]
MNGFYFKDRVQARADLAVEQTLLCELFEGFCHQSCTLTLVRGASNTFVLGAPHRLPEMDETCEYALLADASGVAVVGRDTASLMRGIVALLLKIEPVTGQEKGFMIAACEEQSSFTVKNRMVHLCVFPETTYLTFQKFVRLCGILQYTHIVIEFWGMLKFEVLPELAWPMAFSKQEAKLVIDEARALGMEPVPMFNHLGHASASRLNAGKHVVLDQNPALYDLFTPDGWSWNTQNPALSPLLRAVRRELYELFGEGSYFHLGLDESYMHAKSPVYYALLPEYLATLTHEVVREGRRPMIWLDMFLPEEAYVGQNLHACSKGKTPAQVCSVLERLAPETVLIDWHYSVKTAPVSTATYFLGRGFDVMGAPWLDRENIAAYIETAQTAPLFGVMETTWHTMAHDGHNLLYFARLCGAARAPWSDYSGTKEEVATILRKITPRPYSYEEAGIMRRQINLGAAKMC